MRAPPYSPPQQCLQGSVPRRAFTAVEMMMVILIMSILAVLGMDAISTFEANQRADRAARESLAAFRFARNLATTTGKKAKVVLDNTPGVDSISVYWQSNGSTYDATPYASGMTGSGFWVIKMGSNPNTASELSGTTFAVTNSTGNYTNYFEYSALGNCAQTGTVTFTYSTKTKTMTLSNVGDPQIQ